MVIEWLYGFVTSLVGGFLDLFPDLPSLSGVASNVAGALSYLSGKAALLSAWIPLGQVSAALGLVVAGLLAAFTIKVIRITASFFTAGGGSAA